MAVSQLCAGFLKVQTRFAVVKCRCTCIQNCLETWGKFSSKNKKAKKDKIHLFTWLCFALIPPGLSGGLILPFLAQSWTPAGSGYLLLYQHRARWALGASQCPLSAPAAQTQVCVDSPDTVHILRPPDWARADSAAWICLHKWVCIYSVATVCEGSDPRSPPRIRWPVTSKGCGALSLQPAHLPRRKSCLWRGLVGSNRG